jgi:hypothetical protein
MKTQVQSIFSAHCRCPRSILVIVGQRHEREPWWLIPSDVAPANAERLPNPSGYPAAQPRHGAAALVRYSGLSRIARESPHDNE